MNRLLFLFLILYNLTSAQTTLPGTPSLQPLSRQNPGPDREYEDSLTKTGIVFDTWIGETYWYSEPANGWRSDTVSGWSINVYHNPYITDRHSFCGDGQKPETRTGSFVFYLYQKGKRYTGPVKDSLQVRHHVFQLQAEGFCINGLMHGQARFYFTESDEARESRRGILKCEGEFVNGEMTGPWIYYEPNGRIKYTLWYVKGKKYPEKSFYPTKP